MNDRNCGGLHGTRNHTVDIYEALIVEHPGMGMAALLQGGSETWSEAHEPVDPYVFSQHKC